MNEKRFLYILENEMGSHFFKFTAGEKVIGYVFAVIEHPAVHYWYSFFDLDYMRSHSLGKYMMWRVINWAKTQGHQYVYLGTCYGTASLYKVRDFHGVEFWDGTDWNPDKNLIKAMCKTDDQPKTLDEFKLLERPNEFLEHLLSS